MPKTNCVSCTKSKSNNDCNDCDKCKGDKYVVPTYRCKDLKPPHTFRNGFIPCKEKCGYKDGCQCKNKCEKKDCRCG